MFQKLARFCFLSLSLSILGFGQSANVAGSKPVQVVVSISAEEQAGAAPLAADLSLTVNKKAARVESLTSLADKPLLFAVLADTSSSERARATLLRETCSHVFNALSKRGNRGYLVLVNNQIAINKTPITPEQADARLEEVRLGGGTALYDAILKTVEGPLSRVAFPESPRRALIVVSDGVDTMSTTATLEQALDAAAREGVPIYSLRTWPDYSGFPRGEGVLRKASERTGGVAAFAKKDDDNPIADVLSAIDHQYLLTFTALDAAPGKLQSLKVKSNRKNVSVIAPPVF